MLVAPTSPGGLTVLRTHPSLTTSNPSATSRPQRQVEIEEASLRTHRKLISLVVQQPRRNFARPTKLADKESNEGWASNTNECRPFKDPNFDLRKVRRAAGLLATHELVLECTAACTPHVTCLARR